MNTCICKICNNTFQSQQSSSLVCPDCKSRPCLVCGKSFKRVWPYDQKCCSAECRKVLFNDPNRIAESVKKRDQTVKMKYGVDNVNQLASVKYKISRSKLDKENYLSDKQQSQSNKRPKVTIKNCIICGEEFESTNGKMICPDKHFKTCEVCNKQFEIHSSSVNVRSTCSNECRKRLLHNTLSSKIKICALCGREFNPSGSKSKFCPGPHYRTCPICGKQYELTSEYQLADETAPKTCSPKCGSILAKQTNSERYGVESPHQTPEARDRFKNQSLANTEVRESTNLARYGYANPAKNASVKEKISEAIASEQNQSRMRATMRERYGVDYAMQNHDLFTKQHQSKATTYACDGTKLDSRWEKLFYDFLYRNKIPFEYNTVSIPYELDGRNHVLHVDFKVGDMLFEVKGDHLLEGVGEGVPIEAKLELYKKYHIIVICGSNVNDIFGQPNSKVSDGLKYLDRCPGPLIGVDISLFDYPDFPFAEDKPPCFYKVKVDRYKSSLEAFHDELIRWNMILNRINYSGGFIDAKQVLTALTVTGTCKQKST